MQELAVDSNCRRTSDGQFSIPILFTTSTALENSIPSSSFSLDLGHQVLLISLVLTGCSFLVPSAGPPLPDFQTLKCPRAQCWHLLFLIYSLGDFIQFSSSKPSVRLLNSYISHPELSPRLPKHMSISNCLLHLRLESQ